MKRLLFAASAAILAATVAVQPALADRAATPQEQTEIEAVLKANGYVRWDDIELDGDGMWEVDDARKADGVQYDLKLSTDGYRILRTARDD